MWPQPVGGQGYIYLVKEEKVTSKRAVRLRVHAQLMTHKLLT